MEDVSKVEFAQSYKAVQNDINPNKCTICFFGEIPATSPPIRMSWIFVHGYLIWSIQGTMHLRRPHNDFVNFCRFFCFMVKYPPFRATNQRFGHYFLTSQSTFCLGLSERLAARRAMSVSQTSCSASISCLSLGCFGPLNPKNLGFRLRLLRCPRKLLKVRKWGVGPIYTIYK